MTDKRARILVVEDNALNLKLFRDLLEAQGYEVLSTHDGMEAFRLARSEKPDLVLMDVQLPEVSGLEVAKWMRDDPELSRIPVIAITAFALGAETERAQGLTAVMAKPISIKPFLELVARTLT
jgi:two-component system cell cycle response regulator DivK